MTHDFMHYLLYRTCLFKFTSALILANRHLIQKVRTLVRVKSLFIDLLTRFKIKTWFHWSMWRCHHLRTSLGQDPWGDSTSTWIRYKTKDNPPPDLGQRTALNDRALQSPPRGIAWSEWRGPHEPATQRLPLITNPTALIYMNGHNELEPYHSFMY